MGTTVPPKRNMAAWKEEAVLSMYEYWFDDKG